MSDTKAVGVVDPSAMGDGELMAMHAAGVRGIRVNLYKYQAMHDVDLQKKALREHARAIRGQGWSMAFTHTHPEFWGDLAAVVQEELIPVGIRLVTDHFALLKGASMLAPGLHVEQQPGFKAIMGLVRAGHLYVKLSAPYRVSSLAPGYEALKQLVRAFVGANPLRILWGSDWYASLPVLTGHLLTIPGPIHLI